VKYTVYLASGFMRLTNELLELGM